MPYRWNKNTIDPSSIVESREFDQAHNGFVSLINGGMDRENLPLDCIDQVHAKDNAWGKSVIVDNLYSPTEYNSIDGYYGSGPSNNNPNAVKVVGMTYGSDPIGEGGGFFEIADTDIQSEEGMLTVQWKCNAYMPMYYSYYHSHTNTLKSSRHRYQWRIQIKGVTVYDSPAICQPFFTTNLKISVPIGKGNNNVAIYLRYPEKIDNTNDEVLLQWWGGTLTAHNIYR